MSEGRVFARRTAVPGFVSACAMLWLARTVLALFTAYPLLVAVDATGIVSGPERDAVLFEPGSLLLLEALRLARPALVAALETALLWQALGALMMLLPLAVAFDLLSARERALRVRFAAALASFWRFCALGALALSCQAALLLTASMLGGLARAALEGRDERVLDGVPVLLFAVALLAAVWVGGTLDLARAAVVASDVSVKRALERAVTALYARRAEVVFGSTAAAAAALLTHVLAAWLVTRIDLARNARGPILGAFAIHQLAVIVAIVWRVRWLEQAVRLDADPSDSARH